MTSQMYWILFAILVMMLTVFSIYLVLNIVKDFCVSKAASSSSHNRRKMVRYKFDRTDVEDLTNIKGDLRTVVPRVSLTNEVDNTRVKILLNERIETEPDSRSPKIKAITFIDEDDKPREDLKEKKTISSSVDNLEFCDPTALEVFKSINGIEAEAKKIEENMKSSLGHLSNLMYYETKEKFIRLQLNLCDIYCDRDEVRRRKLEVSRYIEGCQQKLRNGTINKID